MKLKTKLFVGFGSLLLLMILLLGMVMNMLNVQNHYMNRIVKDQYEKVKLATMIRYEFGNMDRALSNLVMDGLGGNFEHDVRALEQASVRIKQALDALTTIVIQDESRQLTAKLKLAHESYIEIQKQVVRLVKAEQKNAAIKLVLVDAAETRKTLLEAVDSLKSGQEQLMDSVLADAAENYNTVIIIMLSLVILGLLIGALITYWIIRSITQSLNTLSKGIHAISNGNTELLPRLEVTSNDEIGQIALSFNEMARTLEQHAKHEREFNMAIQEQGWLKTKVAEITSMYQGVQDLQQMARLFITRIAPMVEANYGVFYIAQGQGDDKRLVKLAAYADNGADSVTEAFRIGEGLVGQSAAENRTIVVKQTPDDYIKIASGLGSAKPASILVLPIQFEGEVTAVVELASFQPFTPLQETMLDQVQATIGVTVNRITGYMQVEKLLKESQALTEELQSQSEELQMQQEELKSINEKLEEQNRIAEQKALELEITKQELEKKAEEVERGSQYKSEFLANMSHELRTPLNSLLILAQTLSENAGGNLTAKQVEYANTINSSGIDLLNLINDILDLSKVESGKMEVHPEDVNLSGLRDDVLRHFLPVARRKQIDFSFETDPDLPEYFYTDQQRLQQILKNLLSNAFKFTERGSVALSVRKLNPLERQRHHVLEQAEEALVFSVKDTGIGIPKGKQSSIFDAFQQADGTTSRKYGGTGLGLSISREIAQLLGGFITVDSVEGEGSIFTLYLPNYQGNTNIEWSLLTSETEVAASLMENSSMPSFQQDTASQEITPAEPEQAEGVSEARLAKKKILVVDDDMRNVFALTTALEGRDMNVVFAENGKEAIQMLRDHPDTDMVLMDIMMPEMNGYEAMSAIRELPEYATLPIIALTAKAMKNDREKCIEAGASDYISKPVNLDQLLSLMRVWLYR
jgi:two-component system chemotaxis sensor kinase CheA